MQLYSVKPTEVDKLAFGFRETRPGKTARGEGHAPFRYVGALNSFGSSIWRVVGLGMLRPFL